MVEILQEVSKAPQANRLQSRKSHLRLSRWILGSDPRMRGARVLPLFGRQEKQDAIIDIYA